MAAASCGTILRTHGGAITGTDNFDALRAAGYLYERNLDEGIEDFNDHVMTFYDAFSAGARDLFWTQMNEDSFSLG